MTDDAPARPASVRADHAAVRLSDRALIVVLGALAAFAPMAVDMYLPALPAIGADLGQGIERVQLTLTAFFIGFSLGVLLFGPLSDRFGRRPFLIGGTALFAAASAACALVEAIEPLLAMRFAQGLGGAAGSVLARAIVRDVYRPGEVARMLSLMAVVHAIAPLLAPNLGGVILAALDWRAIFLALTLFGAACLVAILRAIPETHPPERRGAASLAEAILAYGRILADPPSLGILVCGSMVYAGMFTYIAGTPFAYIAYYGVSPQLYGLLFGLNVVAIMLAATLNSRVVKRLGTGRMLWWAASVAALAGAALALASASGLGGLLGLVVPLFFFLGTVGLMNANCAAELMQRFPANAGAASALFGALQFGLGALASFLLSLLQTGTPAAMGAIIGLAGLLSLAGRVMAAMAGRR